MRPLQRTPRCPSWRLLIGVSLSAMAIATQANALPSGGTVSAGSAQISTSANAVDITQNSSRAVIDWQNFNVANTESVNFQQPSTNAIALNLPVR